VFRGSKTAVEIEGFPKDIALGGRRASPKNTVPSDQNGFPARCPLIPYRPANRYRTLRQGIPYSPTRNTVLSDKKYRTLRQKIPYSPTNSPLLLGPTYPAPRAVLTKVLQMRRLSRVRAPGGQYRTLRQGIPYSPTRNTVLSDKKYRTLRQGIPYSPTKNTVLSDKFAPPLGADLPGSESRFDKSPANAAIIPRKSIRRAIPYSPTRNTVLSDKEYRTLRQGIPYSPTRNTVLSDKEYRTVQQNIPYSPTKWVRDVPAKGRKNVGGRFVRPVCVYC
jgi:hypothetical protein